MDVWEISEEEMGVRIYNGDYVGRLWRCHDVKVV